MKTVQLEVNNAGLIKNLGSVFSDQSKVLIELTQNARRAGSHIVEFNFNSNEQSLSVKDYGCGIADLQNLLSIALSGWSDDISKAESAYGMGFLSTLFSCDHIMVESLGSQLESSTENLINLNAVEIRDTVTVDKGALIVLEGIRMPFSFIQKQLNQIANAYPIDISLNGELLDRLNSEEAVNASGHYHRVSFARGTIYIPKELASYRYTAFLQGISILEKSFSLGSFGLGSLVYLDGNVKARMPDRDKLLDELTIHNLITEAIKGFWTEHYSQLLQSMEQYDFILKHGEVVLDVCPELLCKLDYVPGCVVGEHEDYPVQQNTHSIESVFCNNVEPIAKADIASGKVNIVSFDEGDGDVGFLLDMYIYRKESVYVDTNIHKLADSHWLHELVKDLEYSDVTISYQPIKEASLDSIFLAEPVALTDSYTLEGPFGSVCIHNEGIYAGSLSGFVIPEGEAEGFVIRQASRYESDNEDFVEEAFDSDSEQLERLISRMRCKSKSDYLAQLFSNLPIDVTKELADTGFNIQFNEEGQVEVNEAA